MPITKRKVQRRRYEHATELITVRCDVPRCKEEQIFLSRSIPYRGHIGGSCWYVEADEKRKVRCNLGHMHDVPTFRYLCADHAPAKESPYDRPA